MEKELKIDYDFENDTLYLYSEGNMKGSIELDSLIIDISKKGEILGIEIQNASDFLSKFLKKKVLREELTNINSAKINYKTVNNTIFVEVDFNFNNTEILLPLSMYNPNSVYT
jgi:uncharacterized protein YuzE